MHTYSRAAGFTLVELMITIAILAIVMGIAVPSFSEMIKRNKRASCTNELVGALQLARSEAVRSGRPVTVAARDDEDIATGIAITDAGGTLLLQTAVCSASSVTLTAGELGFTYRGNGQTDMDNRLDIRVCSDSGSDGREISLLTTGVMRNAPSPNCNS